MLSTAVVSADRDFDEAVKVFFFNILLEDFSKTPFVAALLEHIIVYGIEFYIELNEDPQGNFYNFRYLTILQLIGLLLSRSTLRIPLFDKLRESRFLSIMTEQTEANHLKEIFVELLFVLNRLLNKKMKTSFILPDEIDSFLVAQDLPEFVWSLFILHKKKQNLIFSSCASFFKVIGNDNREGLIVYLVMKYNV